MATQTIRVAAPLPAGSYTVNVQTDGSNTNAYTGRTLTAEAISGFWRFTVTGATSGLYAFQVLNGASAVVAYGWFYSASDATVTIPDSNSRDEALQSQKVDAILADTSGAAAKLAGITSLKSWLGALAGSAPDSGTLAEINATAAGSSYNNATDSLQAIRDNGDSAWSGGSSASGAYTVTITVTDGTSPIPGALVKMKAGAVEVYQKTDEDGVVALAVDNNSYSVRITAYGYVFSPVSLVVSGDMAQTFTMMAVVPNDSTWATGDDVLIYVDGSTIGQMLRDDGGKVASADVPTHPIVLQMLRDATAEINAALNVSNRYTQEELDAMPEASRVILRKLACQIAVHALQRRRIPTGQARQDLDMEAKSIEDRLDRLRRGERVLDIETAKEAGIGEAVPFTQADVQRGSPLLRDRMSGTQGVFPPRRFNPRTGQ